MDEGWLEDERNELLEELNLEMLEEQHNEAMQRTADEVEQVGPRSELHRWKWCYSSLNA